MKLKKTIFTLIIIAFSCFNSKAQSHSPATAKGANLLSTTFSFTSQSGDLYGYGGDLGVTRYSLSGNSYTIFELGHKAAYFFDNGSNIIPFLGLGIGYLLVRSNGNSGEDGIRGFLNGGINVRRKHLAFVFESGFQVDNYGEGDIGRTVYMGVGIAAFLYQKEAEQKQYICMADFQFS